MRVISQGGEIDVPYELFVFGITIDNCVTAIRDSVVRPYECTNGFMAKYSTKEKAIKAMEMLREAYSNNVFYHHTATTDEFKDAMRLLSNEKFKEETSEYFQFPQDDEIEV